MKKIKTAYAYLFFFLYKQVSKPKPQFLLYFKTAVSLVALEFMIVIATFIYFTDITKLSLLPEKPNIYLILLTIVPFIFIKFWFFERKDKWKNYVSKFEQWPEKRKKKWNLIMRIIIFFVIANVVFSFYLMSQIDWTKYN